MTPVRLALLGALVLAALLVSPATVSSQGGTPAVTVSFGSATYTVIEGGTVSVSVTLSADPERTVVIPITATNQSGASSGDYSDVPANVTFNSGDTSQEFTFTARADTVDDDGESVLLGFGAPLPAGVSAGSTSESTVSITDTGPVIAITSSPVADGAYTTLEVITVSATFSEAVTVTGKPQLTLDIGGTERIAEYAEPGANTGQLLFRYTVQPTDQDDDGIGVKQDSVTLNGGAIRAADDSADVNLATAAMTFSGHKVDTELVLIGNMEQSDGTALRINAGETVKLSFKYHHLSIAIYEGGHILLDVQTASDTLTLTVTASTSRKSYRLSGSVAQAGIQAFRSDDFAVEHLVHDDSEVELFLTATGSGYVELGTTSSTSEDEHKAYNWSIGDSFSKSTDGTTFAEQTGDQPRFSVIGHAKEVLRVDAVAVISEPADQVAYTAGEDIEVLVFTNAPPWPTTDSLTIPLQVGAHTRQAELVTIGGNFDEHHNYRGLDSSSFKRQVLHFAYTVQPGDVATGVGIGADPLGSAGIEHAIDSRIAKDLSFAAQAPAAGSGVNGSRSEACDAIHCAYVTDRYSFLSPKHGRYAVAPGGQVTVPLVLDPAYPEPLVVPLSLGFLPLDSATLSQFMLPSSVTFNAGETEQSFTLLVPTDVPLNSISVALVYRAFIRSVFSVRIRITNSPENIESSLSTFLVRGYTRPRHPDLLPWSTLSNSTFHYDQRYVLTHLELASQGTAEDDDFDIRTFTTQPLSDEALSRLALVVGGRTLPFSNAYVQSDSYDGDREEGIEETVEYYLDGKGLRWEANQRYAVKIVEVPVTATFDMATYAADEGKTVDVTVTLGGGFRGETVTLPITVTHNGDATDADYADVPESLVFAPMETTKTFTVTVTDDTVDDDDESITLTFGSADQIKSGGTNESATIDLRDDDDPAVTVSFGAASYTVAEGGSVVVTVTLSADPERSVTVPLTATNQDGASSTDYLGVPANVSFASGETSKMFTFAAKADDDDDDNESVKLTFGTLPTRVSEGTTKETVIFITDDCTTGALLCADVEFKLGSGWSALRNKASTPSTFSYNGVQYDIVDSSPRFDEFPPDRFADPEEIAPPFDIPERTRLTLNLEPVGGDCVMFEYHGIQRCDPRVLPNDDTLDWVLHVTTIKDDAALTAALPFSEARHGGTFPVWRWFGRDLHDLAMAWSEGQTYRFRLVREPRAGRTAQPPGPPLYLRHHPQVPVTSKYLMVSWTNPQMRDDSVPLDVTYKVQWKLSSGSWDTPADVSEISVWAYSTSFQFRGEGRELAAGSEYDIRVIASNSAGDGPPSNVFTYTAPGLAQNAPGNRAAEGAPAISGVARVGETLSASTAGISDADGLERATFSYQWLLNGSELSGATGRTYTVVEGAVGSVLSVRVSFTDDGGNEESLTSERTATVVDSLLEVESATVDGVTLKLNYPEYLNLLVDLPESAFTVTVNGAAVTVSDSSVSGKTVTLTLASAVAAGDTVTVGYAQPESDTQVIGDVRGRAAESFSGEEVTNETAPPPLTASARKAPASHDGSTVFTFELHFSEEPDIGYRTLRDHAFRETGGEVTKARRLTAGSNLGWEITVRPSGAGPVTLSLPVTADCGAQGAICTGGGKALAEALEVVVPGQGRTQGWLKPIRPPRNTPARGAPAISGTARVGETLRASTTGIADADGLRRVRFRYRWLADGEAIAGASGSSYTLVASDEGKAIAVRVSFSDDAGHAETLTSAATAAVAPPPLRASVREAPAAHDGGTAFTFELHFSEEPELSYVTLRDHALRVTGGSVVNARRLTPGSNLGWEITVRPSSTGGVTVVLPVTTDCSAEGAVCTGGGKELSERLELTVPGP